MKIKAVITATFVFATVGVFSALSAQDSVYTNVPSLEVSSGPMAVTESEEALKICQAKLYAARHLLVRKSVDIILDEKPCKNFSEPMDESVNFKGTIYFMN